MGDQTKVIRVSFSRVTQLSRAIVYGNGNDLEGDDLLVIGNFNKAMGRNVRFLGNNNSSREPPREKRKREDPSGQRRRGRARIDMDTAVALAVGTAECNDYLRRLEGIFARAQAQAQPTPQKSGFEMQEPTEDEAKQEQARTLTDEDKATMENEGACIICMDMPKTTVLLDCKHKVMCASCTRDAFHRAFRAKNAPRVLKCPACREPVKMGALVLGTVFT
jgi:hypothetical protein